MADETDLVATWITSTLAADTAGAGSLGVLSSGITSRIFHALGDQDETSYPQIVYFLYQPLEDLMLNSTRRVWSRDIWVIKVVGRNHTDAQLWDLVGRVDALLHGKVSNTVGGNVWCHRDRKMRPYQEDQAGVIFRHRGGMYDIKVQVA